MTKKKLGSGLNATVYAFKVNNVKYIVKIQKLYSDYPIIHIFYKRIYT